jgi:hypothetical protein
MTPAAIRHYAHVLRAIASGGYSPERDEDGSTRDVLLTLAQHLESL